MKFSLQETATQCGLSKRMVRALEVRYSIVLSNRDNRGSLYYDKKDIERLKIFAIAIDLCFDIKTIAHCTNEELQYKIQEYENLDIEPLSKDIREASNMIKDFDSASLEKKLYNMRLELSRERLILDFILPLIRKSNFTSAEKSFLDFEVMTFLSQIIKSAYSKEYYPQVILICEKHIYRNILIAASVLLSNYNVKISFGVTTKSIKVIADVCSKTDCEVALLIGKYNLADITNKIQTKSVHFEIIDFSAQELIDTKLSAESIVLSEKINLAVESIKEALQL